MSEKMRMPEAPKIETEHLPETSTAYRTRMHRLYVEDAQRDQARGINCYEIAAGIAARMIDEGKDPFIINVDGLMFGMPHIYPVLYKGVLDFNGHPADKWGNHVVCCEGNVAYDALLANPLPIHEAILAAFGQEVPYTKMSEEEQKRHVSWYLQAAKERRTY